MPERPAIDTSNAFPSPQPSPGGRGIGGEAAGRYYRAAVYTAVAAAVFSLAIACVLIVNHLGTTAANPLDSAELARLQQALRERPGDEAVKQRIRALDLELRSGFFWRQRLAASGRYLLLAGVVVMLAALRVAAVCRRKLPHPGKAAPAFGEEARAASIAQGSVGILGVMLAALVISFVATGGKPWNALRLSAPAPAAAWPTAEELAANWPLFRGPTGMGVAAAGNYPTSWNARTGDGIIWKAAVPLTGASSPVVWGGRVFVTGATAEKCEVYCYDAGAGRLVWQKQLPAIAAPTTGEAWDECVHAAATPATDGRRVCAIFANGQLVCLDYEGNELWSKHLGPLENSYGHASSLAMYRNRLIVLLDQKMADDDTSRSRLAAFDLATGRLVWETRRPVRDSWSTPVVVNAPGRDLILTTAAPWLIAYGAADGAEIWRVNCLEGDVVPSPVYAGGLVFAVMETAGLTAVRPDGSGDVSGTHVAWKADGGFPSICSPVASGDLLFLVTSSGIMTCWDTAAGTLVWEQDLEISVVASPTLVGRNIYVIGEDGQGRVLEAATQYREVARPELDGTCKASPAFVGGRVYVRTDAALFCIGAK